MAGDQHPWRDVFSDADWQIILASVNPTPRPTAPVANAWVRGVMPGAAAPVVAPVVAPNWGASPVGRITRALTAYHATAKDDAALFPTRIGLLQAISAQVQAYLRGRATVKTGAKDTTQGLDPWVASLDRRSAKKQAYLVQIGAWVANSKNKHRDPVLLMQDLAMRDFSNARGTDDEPLLSTTPYAKMEKVDPYHRGITFFTNGTADSIDPYHNNPMAVAFNQWLSFRNTVTPPGMNPNATFYEWLENHPICTGTPGVTVGFDAAYKDQVKKVDYGPTLHPVQRHGGNLLMDLGAGGGFQPLDTASMLPASVKGGPGAAAFAWALDRTLWVHEHAGSFRHTSFLGGKKARCTGMIVVAHGKVTKITPESGHYAPGEDNLLAIIAWLQTGGCVAPGAMAGYRDGSGNDQLVPMATYVGHYRPQLPGVYAANAV